MQVHVAHISTKFRGPHQAHLRIEVCPIEINLPTVIMHGFANINHRLFKHAVGGRIGNHQGRQIGRMLCGLGFQILHINIALRVATHNNNLHANHRR